MTMPPDHEPTVKLSSASSIPWLRISIAVILGTAVVLIFGRNLNLSDIQEAYSEANKVNIALSLLIIIATIILKTWRWELMFVPTSERPRFGSAYHSLVLGQFFNLIFPMRIGDAARIYSIDSQSGMGKVRSLSTLVIEKTLEILGLLLSVILLIPFFVVPDFVLESGYPLALISIAILLLLVVLTFRTEQVISFVNKISSVLPKRAQNLIFGVVVAGLEGLEALRNWKLSLWLGFLTLSIVILSVVVPFLLFLAFDYPFGVAEAVLLNLVVTLGMVPPSTPGKIVVFEGLVILMLRQFGAEDGSSMLSYALTFHLVVILPQIIMGLVAFLRGSRRVPSANGSEVSESTPRQS